MSNRGIRENSSNWRGGWVWNGICGVATGFLWFPPASKISMKELAQ